MKRRKRILYLVGTLGMGGIERLTTDLSLALKRDGEWEPIVCCLTAKTGPFVESLETQGVQIETLTKSNLLTFPFRFAGLLRRLQPDIIHSHFDSSIPWQVLGAYLGGVKKIIFTQHSDYQYWKTHFWARLRIFVYLRVCWPFISAYTAVSQCVQHSVAGLGLFADNKFQVIYNPVDTRAFRPTVEGRRVARLMMRVGDEHFVIGNVARFAQPKGHSFLVQAAALVVQAAPESHFVLIGDGPLRELIELQVKQAGLEDHFLFMGSRTDVQLLYPGFDAFVLPSLREGFPIAVVEAMSCGVPIVAADVGGVAEALGNRSGLLVPPANFQTLADELLRLRYQPNLAGELGRTARQYVMEKFSLDTIVFQYVKLYEHVLENNGWTK